MQLASLSQLNSKSSFSWHPTSWKNYTLVQQPQYENLFLFEQALLNLNNADNIINENEILSTSFLLSEAAKGKAFILQAGDCAETFANCYYEDVIFRVEHLINICNLLQKKIKKPVIPIGRIAGQFAKPRTETTETINNVTLPSYRGDIINGFEFDEKQRKPDPLRLIKAFEYSQLTSNWIKSHINNSSSFPFYISHEALLLDYETAFTRFSKKSRKWYNFSAHFLWLGERTRFTNSAHIEYLRGISNPIGIKIGPNTNALELIQLIKILNPNLVPGKIKLITRIGANKTTKLLPALINKINKSAYPVTWSCDPMHGNGQKTQGGIKTRYFNDIWQELKETLYIHKELGSYLGGVHLELTHSNVTECVGGTCKITENMLLDNYQTLCDARLNKDQSIEIINLLSEHI